jgi:uncharacterized membrane protein required for colicin V production
MEKFMNWLSGLGINALDKVLSLILILLAGILVIRAVVKIVDKVLQKSKLEKRPMA